MSPRLRCFATLATVCATALLGPAALGQPQGATKVPPPDLLGHLAEYWETSTWFGSATCTVMGMNGTGYSGTETHKWEIIPWGYLYDRLDGVLRRELDRHRHGARRRQTLDGQR